MKCSISTYYKILDAELYNFDDMCNVPEEKVIPISRSEYEMYADE